MSPRAVRLRSPITASLALLCAAGCVGQITGGGAAADVSADAAPGGDPDAAVEPPDAAPPSTPATVTFSRVGITTLPGASRNGGALATFQPDELPAGTDTPPALSNSVLSAVPGTPPKPLFIGQSQAFDAVLISVVGQSGHFELAAGGNTEVAVDMVASLAAPLGTVTVQVATRRGQTVSAASSFSLVIDPHMFIAAGDLENHDDDETNIADLFGSFLEGKQGNPAVPEQVLEGEDNNGIIVDGVKGPSGPVPTGHREVVWDGVPELLRNRPDFSETFFDRKDDGNAGVRGGILFAATDGTGEEVNDAFSGGTPDPALVGPPGNDNAPLGGDFSNHNPSYQGNLLSFTQSAAFAPLGTVITDVTFRVAGSDTPGVVQGAGIVFASVDKAQVTSVEYFDENDASVALIYAPVQSQGPFPRPGPAVADRFPFSFVGYVDATARIARIRITTGDAPVDQADEDLPNGNGDVVVFDDVYYSEPNP